MESQLVMAGSENSFDTQLTMDSGLDQPPPPPYQEHNNPLPLNFPSPPSLSSPPPAYSQIYPGNLHPPSAPPQLPSRHGGASSHLPSQLGPGGATSHLPSQLGGARPQKLQQANQQRTNRQITTALRQAGVGNNQRTVDVRLKEEEEEMSSARKCGVAIGIFVVIVIVMGWSSAISRLAVMLQGN